MPPFPDPTMQGVDTVLRIISWNITGRETSLWDVMISVASWF